MKAPIFTPFIAKTRLIQRIPAKQKSRLRDGFFVCLRLSGKIYAFRKNPLPVQLLSYAFVKFRTRGLHVGRDPERQNPEGQTTEEKPA